jgi:5-methylcytosine-specific restriction endonuclease McrA
MALHRAGAFCPKCGKLMTGKVDVHHKTARSRGGLDMLENLQAMCHGCHSRETRRERR